MEFLLAGRSLQPIFFCWYLGWPALCIDLESSSNEWGSKLKYRFLNYYECPSCAHCFRSPGQALVADFCPLCGSMAAALLADEYDSEQGVVAVFAGVPFIPDIQFDL